jgi:hypothetical protein
VECAPLDAIHWAALRWGASEYQLDVVARCESGLSTTAYNAASGASGMMQFLPETYWGYAPSAGETRSYWTASGSADVAAYMFNLGQQRQWVCAYLTGVVSVPHLRYRLSHLPKYCHPPIYKTPATCWTWLPIPKPTPPRR